MNTMKELVEFCRDWKPGDGDGFREIVSSYFAITRTHAPQRVLADEFEAALATVYRWANGYARPRSGMQRAVVTWIMKRAEAAVYEAADEGRQT